MNAAVFVAIACIAPVEHKHVAVGTVTQVHPSEPRIRRNEKVRTMFADITAAVTLKNLLIGTAAVKVQREEPPAILGGPVVALINHHPDVSVATAQVIGGAV